MGKTLGKIMEAMAGSGKLGVLAKHRHDFRENWPEIKEVITQGWPLLTIWKKLRETGRIGFTYHTFLKYVKRRTEQERMESKGQ